MIACGTILFFSCKKENNSPGNATATATQLSQSAVVSICESFAYPDSVFYPAELPSDYIVRPLYQLSGSFGAYPDGLEINRTNGNINISESETGLRYMVWYIASGTTDTCIRYITIGGINYMDSIYVLGQNQDMATPVYNADRRLQPACDGGCEFDDGPDDDDGDGIADEPVAGQEVIPQGIELDKTTGAINLKQSLVNGALGNNPIPGTYKDFILNYRLSDGSAKALNKLKFRMIYFRNRSQIPPALMNAFLAKRKKILYNDQPSFAKIPALSFDNTVQKERELKCRPPYIIVVQN